MSVESNKTPLTTLHLIPTPLDRSFIGLCCFSVCIITYISKDLYVAP